MDAKIVSVPNNGQVCLGKKYAGRDAKIEYISENKIVVTFGHFIPDDQAVFFSDEAKSKLQSFAEYEKTKPVDGTAEKLKSASRGKK